MADLFRDNETSTTAMAKTLHPSNMRRYLKAIMVLAELMRNSNFSSKDIIDIMESITDDKICVKTDGTCLVKKESRWVPWRKGAHNTNLDAANCKDDLIISIMVLIRDKFRHRFLDCSLSSDTEFQTIYSNIHGFWDVVEETVPGVLTFLMKTIDILAAVLKRRSMIPWGKVPAIRPVFQRIMLAP